MEELIQETEQKETERKQILVLLEEGRSALVAALQGVTEEAARRIPAPGRWSILGCVEHIAVSEDYMFSQICIATLPQTPLINPVREAKMLARGTDRTRRIESPPGQRARTLPCQPRAHRGVCPGQPGRSTQQGDLAPDTQAGKLPRNAAEYRPSCPAPRKAD